MRHDVFISYSSQDKKIADIVCGTLEQDSVRCWIAPRDITPGQSYGAEIIRGIDGAKCMVLLFTSSSFNSPHVRKEMERAISKGLIVIPFRLEDIQIDPEWEHYISSAHWLDAINEPIETAAAKLVRSLNAILYSKDAGGKAERVRMERMQKVKDEPLQQGGFTALLQDLDFKLPQDSKCISCGWPIKSEWDACPYCKERITPETPEPEFQIQNIVTCANCGMRIHSSFAICPTCHMAR